METLLWSRRGTPEALISALAILGQTRPLAESGHGKKGVILEFASGADDGSYSAERRSGTVRIRYSGIAQALRAISAVGAGLVPEGKVYGESTPFTALGVMLDVSRNAVMRPDRVKLWLERLALLGYNTAMLYTEDTYALPGEPYFGYLRGAYSAEEIREMDDHAHGLGIELIACIQTLGHLEQVLKWPTYSEVKDTGAVLLADEPGTYALIEKMIAHWAAACRSRRIHIGMDEAHDLGRGRFLDRHGYERGFDIFNRHLARVVEIARRHGLDPMIWSDMYFRMGSVTGEYYDKASRIPPEVAKQIPRAVQLVYWDYYHEDEAFYLEWIARHRALGSEPLMASGIWTWSKLWYDQRITEATAGACIQACRKAGLKELLFTLWGDDGAYCEFESAWPGLAYGADLAYGGSDGPTLARRYAAVCGGDYAADTAACGLHAAQAMEPAQALWDDPLLAIYLLHERRQRPGSLEALEARCSEVTRRLAEFKDAPACADRAHGALLAQSLGRKVALLRRCADAYERRDLKELSAVRAGIPAVLVDLGALQLSFRKVWLASNKVFGFEVIQGRLGWLTARYQELDRRLDEFISGKIAAIDEFEAQLAHPLDAPVNAHACKFVATASSIR